MKPKIEYFFFLFPILSKQFSSPVVPPSIPVWQLQSQHIPVDNDHDKNDDAGSGSGSSETEVVTKNSDSSLEMM